MNIKIHQQQSELKYLISFRNKNQMRLSYINMIEAFKVKWENPV